MTALDEIDELKVGLLAGFAAALLWGVWPVVSRLGVQTELTPYDVTFIRFVVSGLVLLPVLLKQRLSAIPISGAMLLMIGAGAPYVLITVVGLQYTDASHGGLVVPSFNIVFSTLGAAIFLGSHPSKVRLMGLVLVLIGCGTIFAQSLVDANTSVLFGDGLFAISGFLYAIYSVSSQKFRVSPWHAVSIVSVFSAVIYIPPYLLFLPNNLAQTSIQDIATQAIFQGLFTAIFAVFLFSTAIAKLGAAKAVVFLALMPVFAMVTAIPVLGEWPTAMEWAALVIIVSGIFIALEFFPRHRDGQLSPQTASPTQPLKDKGALK